MIDFSDRVTDSFWVSERPSHYLPPPRPRKLASLYYLVKICDFHFCIFF